MREVVLSNPAVVTLVTTDDMPGDAWKDMCDALSHVATAAGPSHLDLPLASAPLWLWWFATPGAGQWVWERRVVEYLIDSLGDSGTADEVLALDPVDQAVWPRSAGSDSDLGLRRTLTDPQRREVARMIRLGGGANFSVPGAGKTTMAYATWAALRFIGDVDRCLVVAPLSAHETWTYEPVKIFSSNRRPNVSIRPDVPVGDVVVVNYERLESPLHMARLIAWIEAGRALVIFDEAHRAKAGTIGVRGAAALQLSRAARRRIVLTGTPRPNAASDLVNVLELAYPGRGASLAGSSPNRLAAAYCRITKDELGLPPLVPRLERVPMSEAHERVYAAMIDAAARAVILDPALTADLRRAGRIAMLLLQATCDPTAVLPVSGDLHMTDDRADADLEALIRDLPASFVPTKLVRCAQLVGWHRAAGKKVLVWACFRHHVERLRHLLAPYCPAVVVGSMPVRDPSAPTDREREIARFRADKDCAVLVATPHTLSEGVSLHHTTTHQIHLDRTFNAGMFLQSLDRTHRLGLAADADCTVTYLIAMHRDGSPTIDDVVANRLEQKVVAMARVLNDRGISTLALPDDDDVLTDADVLLGVDRADDLAVLFAHLRQARAGRAG